MNIIHIGEIIEIQPVNNEMEELYIIPRIKSVRNSTSIDMYVPEHYNSNDIKNVLMSTGLSEDFIEDVLQSFPKLDINPIVEVPEQERVSNEYTQKSPKKKKKKFNLYKAMTCFNIIK